MEFGPDGTCSLLDDPDFPLYIWDVLTCRSRVDVELLEVRDEAIELSIHQCVPNLK